MLILLCCCGKMICSSGEQCTVAAALALRSQDLLLSLVAMALATPVTHNIAVIATTFAARVTAIEAAAARDAAVRVDDMQADVAAIDSIKTAAATKSDDAEAIAAGAATTGANDVN